MASIRLPGLRSSMGRWTYYTVRMTMRELASWVKFASEIEDSNALSDALQRTLDESRAREAIAKYLHRQPDRFFNSIVIATLDEPKWYPVDVQQDPALALMADDLDECFGVLILPETAKFFALDGQHRLSAIKQMLDPTKDLYRLAPENFEMEQQSVILVIPGEAESPYEFKERFRRLFGNLNRYAKAMDLATSIIMDEDDAIAICTRRLFSAHEFFKTIGPEKDSLVIDTRKGSSITNPRATHLTKLEILYKMNSTLLESAGRNLSGWFDSGESTRDFIRFRPEDEVLDALYKELAAYWDALLDVLPVLKSEASKMRNHAVVDNPDRGEERDHLLFWPIGQLLLSRVARNLFDQHEVASGDFAAAKAALAPLGNMAWDLDQAPWKHFLLVPNDTGGWRMRNEDGAKVRALAESIITAIALYGASNPELLQSLSERWKTYLLPALEDTAAEEMWATGLGNLGVV